nr:DUF4124 domain-containing protein [Pseudomonas cichorii]
MAVARIDMRLLNVLALWLSLGVFAPLTAHAADPDALFYRYIDSRGVTVLDRQGVPPEYVAKGYEVLNARGRVVQTVPPAPTAEEVRKAAADKLQANADAQLLSLYSSVEEVDRVKARRLAELDALIGVAQGNIQGLNAQQRNMQSQAADLERAGRPIPQVLIDQLNDVQDQQQRIQADITRYQTSRVQAEASFAEDRVRVEKLLR